MNEKPAPTMRLIAGRAGVSLATVSLALRNHLSLPVATRRRIQALADEMGYRPNPQHAETMARVRARKQLKWGGTLAFLTWFSNADGWRKFSPLFCDYFTGADHRARQLGYHVEEIWGRAPGMTGRRLSAVLKARGIRGVLVGPVPQSRGHISLDWSQFAAAAMGYSAWQPALSRVAVNHHQCMVIAWRRLWKLGYRRIGFALPSLINERVDRHWSAVILDSQQRIPKSDRIPPFLPKQWEDARFIDWFQRYRPDVILSFGPGQLELVRQCGYRVPEDVGIASMQWDVSLKNFAGVRHNGTLIGAAAVDLVVGQLQRNETGIPAHPQLVLTPPEWVDGPTVRRLTAAR